MPDREVLVRQSERDELRDELRDALEDAIRHAYCTPLYPPRPGEDPEVVQSVATAAIITDPTAMRHLARIQAAAWAAVEARVEETDG
jgi:hypothetical protein